MEKLYDAHQFDRRYLKLFIQIKTCSNLQERQKQFDSDNDVALVITRLSSSSLRITRIYRNQEKS